MAQTRIGVNLPKIKSGCAVLAHRRHAAQPARIAFSGRLCVIILCVTACSIAALADEPDPGSAQVPGVSFRNPASPALAGGLGYFAGESWGLARSELQNTADQPCQVLVKLRFTRQPNVTFVRPIWLAAHSLVTVNTPMRPGPAGGENNFGLTASIHDASDAARRLDLERDTIVMASNQRPTLGLLSNRKSDGARMLAAAIRFAGGLSPTCHTLRAENFPENYLGYQSLDALILDHDQPDLGPMQISAIRQWILAGGNLWVLADRVDPSLIARIVQGHWNGFVLDDVTLASITLQHHGNEESFIPPQPIRMTRILGQDWTIVHEIDDYPASMVKRIGRGRVIVTTLAPAGWYATTDDPQRPEPRRSLRDLAQWVNQPNQLWPNPSPAITHAGVSRIGYRIIDRNSVMLVLGGFIAALIIAGVWLGLRNKLEHTGWVGVSLASLAGLCLLVMGWSQRSSIPLTVSQTRIARIEPVLGQAVIQGHIAAYSPGQVAAPWRSDAGGMLWPDFGIQRDDFVQLETQSIQEWTWQGLELPSGALWQATTHQVAVLDHQVAPHARLTERGLELTWPGDAKRPPLADPMVTFAGRRLAMSDGADDTLVGDNDLGENQFVVGNVLDEVQQRHQLVYRDLFHHAPEVNAGTTPGKLPEDQLWLLGWTESFANDITLPVDHVSHDQTLLIVPLSLSPTPSGQRVRIPATLIPGEFPQRGAFFRDMQGQVLDMTAPMNVTIRFTLPPQVRPLTVESGRLTLDFDAELRTAIVRQGAGPTGRVIGQARRSHVGLWEIDLDENIPVNDDGTVNFTLQISMADQPETLWRLRSVSLQLVGRVGPRDQPASRR